MNSLVMGWLAAAAVVVLVHRFIPAGGWLMLHLLLLGAISTAILIWSQHFADSLLRHPARGGRAFHGARLAAHTLGAVGVVVGIVGARWPLVLAGGILIAVNAVVHAVSLIAQARGGLPARFAPLVRYYVIACLALVAGVTLGVVLARSSLPAELQDRFVVAHLGANLLGWSSAAWSASPLSSPSGWPHTSPASHWCCSRVSGRGGRRRRRLTPAGASRPLSPGWPCVRSLSV